MTARALAYTLAFVAIGCTGEAVATDPVSEQASTSPSTRAEGRTRVVEGMADPDVLRIDDDHYLLSGTLSTVDLPLFTSNDLRTWTYARTFNPSHVDPAHDYCFIWAPDLARKDDRLLLHFSAHRVRKGTPCPPAGREVTTYRSEAPLGTLDFGVPAPLFENSTGARTYSAANCPAQGCDRAIRIDSTYDPESDRLFYVYFQDGNNIASIPLGNPGAVLRHSGPAATAGAVRPWEEGINEGPDLFRKDGLTYLFISTGHFQGQYATQYIVGRSPEDLTRRRALRRLSTPVARRNGRLLETHGHNSVVMHRGEAWNFFHLGVFDGDGRLVRRDTYRQPIAFGPGGAALSQNEIRVRWSAIAGAAYSLDLVLRNGSTIGPCIDAGLIGGSTTTTFTGVCPGAGDRLVHKSEIAALRVFWSTNGSWVNFADVPYDGVDDAAFIALPGGRLDRVGLSWDELETGTDYSLDVKDAAGRWTAPCVGAHVLHSDVAYEYDGACRTAGTRVEASDVRAYRVCSARNGNWGAARCREIPFDGATGRAFIPSP